MAIYGRHILDTLHERVGDEEQMRENPRFDTSRNWVNGVWGRVIIRHGEARGDPRGIYGDGPAYETDMTVFQIGTDIYRKQQVRDDGTKRDRDHLGIMGSYGNMDGNVTHNLLTFVIPAGHAEMDAWSLGGFWTHFEPDGFYFDAIVQGTWYDITFQSPRLDPISTDGFGLALSGETGYPLHLNKDWQIEPQAQLIYQMLKLDGFRDPAADVRFRDLDSLVGRIGFRLSNRGNHQGWLRGNIWHEFLGKPVTEFSSANGFVGFRATLPRNWWQVGIGGSMVASSNLTLYGQANYEQAFEGGTHAWDAKLGIRYNF